MNRKTSLVACMVVLLMSSSIAFGQTPDSEPPSREAVCEEADLHGRLLGLCRAYWEANDCDVVSSTQNRRSCDAIKENFARLSGGLDIDSLFQASTGQFIGPEGGELLLSGVAKVTFPQDALTSSRLITVQKSNTADVREAFDTFAGVFRPAYRLGYEIRISTGLLPPISDTVHVEIIVPDTFLSAVPEGYQIELFAQLLNDGGEEVIDLFEIFDAGFNVSEKRIVADLPTSVFSERSSAGNFEAIITLAPTPGINRADVSIFPLKQNMFMTPSPVAKASSECKAASINCPLASGCTVTSPFNPARKHPVTGEVKPHTGVDYRASNGSVVEAAADGRVETSRVTNGYGETLVIRHTDGSATLYAHLQQREVQVGASVSKGQRIATSDNTGTSTGPHLHFEYVPNGQIFRSKGRIDPDACVGALVSGSITVRDNGNLADDAFRVYLDGLLIGATSIGASNTLAVNNLIPGNHDLSITAIIAPDNLGTYEVTLNDGLTFSWGGVSTSGTLPQGGATLWTIVVPD